MTEEKLPVYKVADNYDIYIDDVLSFVAVEVATKGDTTQIRYEKAK